jgi:hypothetical protein
MDRCIKIAQESSPLTFISDRFADFMCTEHFQNVYLLSY